MHVDFGNGFDALETHVRQHVGLDATKERVVIHLVHQFLSGERGVITMKQV